MAAVTKTYGGVIIGIFSKGKTGFSKYALFKKSSFISNVAKNETEMLQRK